MEDLFDQLKSAGPLRMSNTSPAKSFSSPRSNLTNTEQFNKKLKFKSSGIRRESLPSPIAVSSVLENSKSHKARSLSPPKYGANNIKSLKVKLERKKLEEFLTRPLEEHAKNIRKKQEKFRNSNKNSKVTPTKAQQKLFETSEGREKTKFKMLKQFDIKPCKVRIHRDNFQKLLREFKFKNTPRNEGKFKNNKRTAIATFTESPSKKGKLITTNNKSKNSFFIKLNTSPTSKIDKKLKNSSRTSPSLEAHHNKLKNSKFNTTTTPTKFSRSQLLRSFGKRFFNVQVKIERCTHPLMLTFESNDRARRMQSKRNKSKNLSVSFREQVEIFGGSSDSDDSCNEDLCAIPTKCNNRKNNISHPLPVPVTPVVMPARLKKVENGKVVDDIELDPSLFVDPKILVCSTPFSPGRKKRDHKSYSPLKDESSPSPRKEQLKLANEKIPPSGLRRLNVDEDDEDDDCEYIVPIEMPQRRTSRTSSNTTLDDLVDSSVNFPGIFLNDDASANKIDFTTNVEIIQYTKHNIKNHNAWFLANGSNESFKSAKENKKDENGEINKFSPLRISPTSMLKLDLGTCKSSEKEQLQQTNGDVSTETSSRNLSTLNTMDDISMNLFLEDSQTNEDDTHAKSVVDSLINETIDKLSKDIDEETTDKHYTDTT